MAVNIQKGKGLTWHHVILIIVSLWLVVTLIGGEAMKAGSFEISGIGCAVRGKDFSRSVDGLSKQSPRDK